MVHILAKDLKDAKKKAKERGLKVSSVRYNKTADMKTGTDTERVFSAKKKKR